MIREIAEEQYFYPEVKEIVSKSLIPEGIGKVILIIGQPGSGKSVFMSQLYDEFKNKVEYLTAIRAEFLKEEDSPKKVYELFEKVQGENKPKVLLLDSLDVLAYSRRKELQEWLYYVDKLKSFKGMTVICASRSFEAEHLYPMNEQKWSEKIQIRLLPDEFINKILNKLKYNYCSITPRFREFLRIPLHLRITTDIIKNGGDPKDICTLQGIFAKLCESLNLSTKEKALLVKLAELMVKNRSVYLPYPSINTELLDNIKKMERPGITAIIKNDATNQKLGFSHQTFIDYFLALKFINKNKSMVEFVLEHNQSLFIRSVLRHILGFLRSTPKRLFKELNELFLKETIEKGIGFVSKKEKIKMHIKTAVLANIASWNNLTPEEGKFLLRLFREPKDKQTFIIQFFNSLPNSEWYSILRDIYIIPLLKSGRVEEVEYRWVLAFLSRIAKDIPSEILNNICPLLLAKGYNQDVEWFFIKISDELCKIDLDDSLKEKYTDLLEQVVKRGFIRGYYEILRICQRIAKYLPEKGLNLYFDSIKKELQNKTISIGSPRGSLTDSFDELLPAIYERIPYQVLLGATGFFEEIISRDYSSEGRQLPDWPFELLYSEHALRFGLYNFYNWYKDSILEFCSKLTEEAKLIIEKLKQSRWESQRQLSMLCKIENISNYKDEIFNYIKKILRSDLKDKSMYAQSELFIRAIEKVLRSLSKNERKEIIESILNLEFEDKLQVREWIWKPLNHIPEEFRDEHFKKRLEEIRTKYNFEREYKYAPPIKITIGPIGTSPVVSADELQKMTLDELYNFLIKNRELKERWDDETDKFYGGVEELAKEVAKVFVEDLDRYKGIIEKLSKESENDVYLSYLFWEVSSKGIDNKHIDWLLETIRTTYKRETLQLEIGRVLCKIVNNLNREQFDKLKDILLVLSNAKDPEEDWFLEYRKQGYANDALTEGINSVRGVVADLVILLLSKFRDDYLIDILERLSCDETISVRAVLIRYLPYAIKPLGWDKSFELFSNAFEKGAEEYTEEIPDFLQYVPEEKVVQIKEILNKMKEKRDGKLGEAYALIMTIYYLREFYSEKNLIDILNDSKLAVEGKRKSFNLLAKQVKFKENVDKCLKIIEHLLEQEDALKGRVSILFMEAQPEDLQKFIPIIKKIVRKPQIRGEALYQILEYLEKSLLIDAMQVFDLLEYILSEAGVDFCNLREFVPATHSKAPLNIINTILECYPEEENRALAALDTLIKLNWSGVNEYLNALERS